MKWEQIPQMVQRKLQKVVNFEVKHAIFFVYSHILLRGESGHFSTPFLPQVGSQELRVGLLPPMSSGPLGA